MVIMYLVWVSIALRNEKLNEWVALGNLSKHHDEKVVRLHFAKVGAKLTRLSDEQAGYIGVAPEGPFKPEHYRY